MTNSYSRGFVLVHVVAGYGKSPSLRRESPPGMKPALISNRSRGGEAPLFYGSARIRDFFRGLPGQILILCLVPCFAYGQITYPEQEVRVHDLPRLTAQSPHARYVLATSLEMVLHDKEVCCGKDSALDDSLQAADPKSLKDINSEVQGKHRLSDGRPIAVTTEYLTPDQVTAGHIVLMILNQHAPLMLWNSHIYVVCGVTYVEDADYSSGGVVYTIHKYLLQDVRFSDSRRDVSFDRVTEDPTKVEGLLFLQSEPQ